MDDLVGSLRRHCANGGFVDVMELFPMLTLDASVFLLLLARSVLTSLFISLGLAVLGVRFNQIATGQVSEFQEVRTTRQLSELVRD